MPRYSAVSEPIQSPALKTASTSSFLRPASASAFRAASAWSWKADLCGSFPCSSASAAPTIATRPRIRWSAPLMSALGPGGAEAGQRDLRRHVLEDHLDRHPDPDAGGVGLDADQVGHEPRPLLELDDREHVGRRQREVPRAPVHDREGVERAATAHPLPLEVRRETMRAGPARIEVMTAARATALEQELVATGGLPEGTRLGCRNGKRAGVLGHGGSRWTSGPGQCNGSFL